MSTKLVYYICSHDDYDDDDDNDGLLSLSFCREIMDAAPWIFAFAAGIFIYLSLVEMMPELRRQKALLVASGTSPFGVGALQHTGVISGFAIMVLLSFKGIEIDVYFEF